MFQFFPQPVQQQPPDQAAQMILNKIDTLKAELDLKIDNLQSLDYFLAPKIANAESFHEGHWQAIKIRVSNNLSISQAVKNTICTLIDNPDIRNNLNQGTIQNNLLPFFFTDTASCLTAVAIYSNLKMDTYASDLANQAVAIAESISNEPTVLIKGEIYQIKQKIAEINQLVFTREASKEYINTIVESITAALDYALETQEEQALAQAVQNRSGNF